MFEKRRLFFFIPSSIGTRNNLYYIFQWMFVSLFVPIFTMGMTRDNWRIKGFYIIGKAMIEGNDYSFSMCRNCLLSLLALKSASQQWNLVLTLTPLVKIIFLLLLCLPLWDVRAILSCYYIDINCFEWCALYTNPARMFFYR